MNLGDSGPILERGVDVLNDRTEDTHLWHCASELKELRDKEGGIVGLRLYHSFTFVVAL
jgi:hypothetical protein